MRTLHQKWLCDKSSALCAAILACTDLGVADRGERKWLESATRFVANNVTAEHVGFLADSTLALLEKVPETYRNELDHELLPNAISLSGAIAAGHSEIEFRDAPGKRLPEILIAHAVYLLKQPHLSIRDFIKWLKRCKEPETRGIGVLLKGLDDNRQLCVEIDDLLDLSRDASEQTRNRIDAVDRLYDAFAALGGPTHDMLWWLRICLSFRSSLYCWPLMVAGSSDSLHGISLPIGMFLSRDGKSKVYFKIVNPRGSVEHRHYVRGTGDTWAHMEGSQLQWNDEWARAFQVGVQVAKTLWSTQNGRLRFVDELAADAMMNASVVVDLGAACAIVDAVLDGADGGPYRLSGRSAEAYWVQAVLGMMLPGRELPLGVVTGRVQMADGVEELHFVEGISKKLEYANNAGFSRIVLPLEDSYAGASEASEPVSDHGDNYSDISVSLLSTSVPPGTKATCLSPPMIGTSQGAETSEDGKVQKEVQAFLQSLTASSSRKRVEINFCRNVRNVADAMQMSGWRRTAFLRLPEAQRAFAFHLRRWFLLEKVELGMHLTDRDRRYCDQNPLTARETRILNKLDDYLLSDTRAIKFVDRAKFEEVFSNGAEAEIGRWLAWKDHQVRRGSNESVRGPGLGILCVRSTEGDNEMRLWSAIADTLSASPEWWNQFQWSSVDQAAQLLAQLLGNRRANPSICSTSAPDLLVLFDDANFTQRRTNPIFPDDFRGQWLDLLNATKSDRHATHPLNEALSRGDTGSLGTRIIVVHGPPSPRYDDLPDTLDAEDKETLARLAVFRFDFSKQAAYAMINYGRPPEQRLAWPEVDYRLKALTDKRVLVSTRGRFYVQRTFLWKLREESPYFDDPLAHLHAAKSMAPILEPRDLFVASNRDRALEPVSTLEAMWHLRRARVLVPARCRKVRIQCDLALSTLTFLRPFPDWDTVKLLQRSSATLADAVELGRELLDQERLITLNPPHSSRVAAYLNVVGDFGRSLCGPAAESRRAQLADEATTQYTNVLLSFEALSASDCRRQKRKLFSDYVYCMKMLDVSGADPRLAGPLRYLEDTIDEIVSPDFYDCKNLDDYPLSQDWLRSRWDDAELTLRHRSTAAYAAARLHIDRWRDGELVRDPWDQPWIEYFALTRTEDFDARQIHRPLTTWQRVYGSDRESTEGFGQRVRDFASYLPRKNEDISWWGSKIRSATNNLWQFINHSEPEKQLRIHEAEIALRFIRIIVMYETLPAFDFIERCGPKWLAHWPRRLGRSWSRGWNELAAQVVGGRPGWISMLSSLITSDEQSIELVQSWLHAYCNIGGGILFFSDPEDLRLSTMPLADTYRRQCANAIWNGYQLLARRNQHGWAIYSDLRMQYADILRELVSGSNSWFFALASRKPHPASIAGAYMMLEDGISEESVREIANNTALEHFKSKLLRNIPEWIKNASAKERAVFEKLRQGLGIGRNSKMPDYGNRTAASA